MTEVATVSASCRTINNADSKGPAGPLFVLVHWHEDSKLFDTWITDCSDAWSATGQRNTSINIVFQGWASCPVHVILR
jgi:hypothetical protein